MTMSPQLEIFLSPTSSAADSPAKISASPAQEQASSTALALVSGASSLASSAKPSPESSSSKTSQSSPAVGYLASCKILPTSGSWGHGTWWPQPASEPRTSDDASLSLLPTPSASTYGSNQGGAAGRSGPVRESLDSRARKGMLPTPTCNTSTYQRDLAGNVYPSLHGMASRGMLPTPRASDADKGGRVTPRKSREGGTLTEAVSSRMYPTPTAHLAKETGAPSEARLNTPTLTWQASGGAAGSLHPQFVEWMMGFPVGWTDLDDDDRPTTNTDCTPSGTPSCPKSPK